MPWNAYSIYSICFFLEDLVMSLHSVVKTPCKIYLCMVKFGLFVNWNLSWMLNWMLLLICCKHGCGFRCNLGTCPFKVIDFIKTKVESSYRCIVHVYLRNCILLSRKKNPVSLLRSSRESQGSLNLDILDRRFQFCPAFCHIEYWPKLLGWK